MHRHFLLRNVEKAGLCVCPGSALKLEGAGLWHSVLFSPQGPSLGISVLNKQAWSCVPSSGHPAESMSLIPTMPHFYSKLTSLTPKSLFPQLGLLGPFIPLNSPHKALVTPTVFSKLNWDGKRGGGEKEVENSQTLILHLKETEDICMLNRLPSSASSSAPSRPPLERILF